MTDAPRYPGDWDAVSAAAKERAGWKCERCWHAHDPEHLYILTVHHLDGNPLNNADWNLAVLCLGCKAYFRDAPLLGQLTMFDAEPWLAKHREGYLAAMRTAK